jgi:hypothetical protein
MTEFDDHVHVHAYPSRAMVTFIPPYMRNLSVFAFRLPAAGAVVVDDDEKWGTIRSIDMGRREHVAGCMQTKCSTPGRTGGAVVPPRHGRVTSGDKHDDRRHSGLQ